MKPITCESGVRLLNEYLEGELPAAIRAALDAHLAACPRCVAFVESYRATPRIVREAATAALPAELKASLRDFLRARRRAPSR